jgi:hypothetical protein
MYNINILHVVGMLVRVMILCGWNISCVSSSYWEILIVTCMGVTIDGVWIVDSIY